MPHVYRLKVETLDLRRLKSDLTMMSSIIRVFLILIRIAFSMSLIVSPFTLVVTILDFIRSTVVLTAFSNAFVWNRLPAHVVNSESVAIFKRRHV